MELFSKEIAETLLIHRLLYHQVNVKPHYNLPYRRIYNLSEFKLLLPNTFIKTNLSIGFSRLPLFSALVLMLVAKTQHIELQFCVNYEILYLDMLKYGYPFALVSELLDQVSEALIFTNLTHCNSHHNIQIQAGDKWKTAMPVDNGDVKY